MNLWRRITAIVLAAAMAVSPAVACADFCPQPSSAAQSDESSSPKPEPATSVEAAMPADCADATPSPLGDQSQAPGHDPNCQGCSDCPAIASAKSPALAFASAVSVDAPSVITVDLAISPVANSWTPARHRLTPPANGPPHAETPVTLKNNLRL
jgi:hypothetical protein